MKMNHSHFSPTNIQPIQQDGETTNLQSKPLSVSKERQENKIFSSTHRDISNREEKSPQKNTNRTSKKFTSNLFLRMQVRPKDTEGSRYRDIFLSFFFEKVMKYDLQ